MIREQAHGPDASHIGRAELHFSRNILLAQGALEVHPVSRWLLLDGIAQIGKSFLLRSRIFGNQGDVRHFLCVLNEQV